MTGIIKFSDAIKSLGVRALEERAHGARQSGSTDPELSALRSELDRAGALLKEKDAEISRYVQALNDAFKDGQEDGRKAALKAAASERQELVATLRTTIEGSLSLLERDLSSMERLAVVLATESLEKILGEPGAFSALAAPMIRQQLEKLDTLSVLRIEVSSADFTDTDKAAALAMEIGQPAVEIRRVDELRSGDCRIKLVLGALEVGVNQQWSRLKATLSELAEPGDAQEGTP